MIEVGDGELGPRRGGDIGIGEWGREIEIGYAVVVIDMGAKEPPNARVLVARRRPDGAMRERNVIAKNKVIGAAAVNVVAAAHAGRETVGAADQEVCAGVAEDRVVAAAVENGAGD